MKVLEKTKAITNGGIEAFLFNTTSFISGVDITYHTDLLKNDNNYKSVANKMGREVIVPDSKISEIKFKPLRILKKFLSFSDFCKKNHYDIVHFHLTRPYDVMYSLCVKKHTYVIFHSHFANRRDYRLSEKITECFFKFIMRIKGDAFVACSDPAAEWMFPENIVKNKQYTVVKNGIEADKFVFNPYIRDKIRKELNIDNKFVIGHIGRFSYQKNHSFLIDIFNEVYKKNKDAVLLLVGDGELDSEIREKVNSYNLSDNVIFYGTTDKVNELYQTMDCFVFPSHFEGLGIVAIEAQAAGLNTLCADTVPVDAKITDLFNYMPLHEPAENWADKVLGYSGVYERKDMSMQIKAAGYDIRQSAEQLKNIYSLCGK